MKKVAHYGPARGGVGVWDDGDRLVLVRWREHGQRRQESYPRTTTGRKEARAFAKGVAEGRLRKTETPVAPVTVRELWRRYLDANGHSLRPASLRIYALRWRPFEAFAGFDVAAASVTLEELDRYAKALAGRHAPNQVALHLQIARLVYRWGRLRGLLETGIPEHRYKLGKDQRRHEPDEYLRGDFEALVAALDPRKSREWRAWALLMLIGHQGARVNAALRLTWGDVGDGVIAWPAATDKMGRGREQPLTWGALAALETARWWRGRDGYAGPWVFYRGRGREAVDAPYTVQSAWYQLREAETRAGVRHRERRAFHGLRKMNSGDVADQTGDPWLALQWIGDTDPRRAREYVKGRAERMERAAAVMDRASDDSSPTIERQSGGVHDS